MGWDVLSRDGSTIGYAGYVQDEYVPTVNHVRHRVMKTDLGRWVQRDPAGYVEGSNFYQYVRGMPIGSRDPSGLLTAMDLIRWYFTAQGRTMIVKGQDLDHYRGCIGVAGASQRIRSEVWFKAEQAAMALHDRITCECGKEPDSLIQLARFQGLEPVASLGPVHYLGSAPNHCLLIGGHIIRWLAVCVLYARCTAVPYPEMGWSEPGLSTMGFRCAIQHAARDRFTEPLDIGQYFGRSKAERRMWEHVQDQSLGGTSYWIEANWTAHLRWSTLSTRPWSLCETTD